MGLTGSQSYERIGIALEIAFKAEQRLPSEEQEYLFNYHQILSHPVIGFSMADAFFMLGGGVEGTFGPESFGECSDFFLRYPNYVCRCRNWPLLYWSAKGKHVLWELKNPRAVPNFRADHRAAHPYADLAQSPLSPVVERFDQAVVPKILRWFGHDALLAHQCAEMVRHGCEDDNVIGSNLRENLDACVANLNKHLIAHGSSGVNLCVADAYYMANEWWYQFVCEWPNQMRDEFLLQLAHRYAILLERARHPHKKVCDLVGLEQGQLRRYIIMAALLSQPWEGDGREYEIDEALELLEISGIDAVRDAVQRLHKPLLEAATAGLPQIDHLRNLRPRSYVQFGTPRTPRDST